MTSRSVAKPAAVGTYETLERWVEFTQGGTVKGREVVSIVPQSEIKMVVKDAPPAPGASKVQVLRGNEYVRVWLNKAGNYYLIHLPAGGKGKCESAALQPHLPSHQPFAIYHLTSVRSP